jgi:hypothetical protein
MRRLALAIALASLLSVVARAGEIHTTGAVSPPPPPSTMTTTGELITDQTALEDSSTVLTLILTLIDIVP